MSTPDAARSTPEDYDCFFHGVEPLPEEYYQLCGECGHVWETRDDLLRDDLDLRTQIGLQQDPEAPIRICPLCTHDF